MTHQDDAFDALVAPYLTEPATDGYDSWHVIDNADADDVRHALEAAIERLIRVQTLCDEGDGYLSTGRVRAAIEDTTIRHPSPGFARIAEGGRTPLSQYTEPVHLPEPDHCHAGLDGECFWDHCPQLRDGEPVKSGRHCPIDNRADDEMR